MAQDNSFLNVCGLCLSIPEIDHFTLISIYYITRGTDIIVTETRQIFIPSQLNILDQGQSKVYIPISNNGSNI
jgi:hypothetical protein